MAFIREIPVEEAIGEVREAYESDLKALGYVANYTKVFALRPEVRAAWGSLIQAVRSTMDARRYELITFASASQLRCSY
jgi:alkylhydroperoxidase/carboxymuconolactone decarboxylase family protein YurZ